MDSLFESMMRPAPISTKPSTPNPNVIIFKGLAEQYGSVLEYDFRAALFKASFDIFFHGGVLSRSLVAYLCFIIFATLLTATASCEQVAHPPTYSLLLGSAGCWTNTYAMNWGDITLMTLTSFLLGLLVNNVLTRWWTTRTLVQDALNTAIQVYFLIHAVLEPRAGKAPEALEERDRIVASVKRRLRLAFRIMLLSARTDDTAGGTEVVRQGMLELLRPATTPDGLHHRGPLLLDQELELLNHHRYTYLVPGWMTRDVTALVGPHMNPMRLGDLLTAAKWVCSARASRSARPL